MFVHFIVFAPIVFSAVGTQEDSTHNDGSDLYGSNVCTKRETYPYEAMVETQVPYEVNTMKWCLKIPFRCHTTRIAVRKAFKKETRLSSRTVRFCCKGYKEANDLCIPICDHCIYGQCIAPNTCRCQPGYSGLNCNVRLPTPQGSKGVTESSMGAYLGALTVIVLLVSAYIFGFIIYYRRRVSKVNDNFYVSYSAAEESNDTSIVGSTLSWGVDSKDNKLFNH